MASLKQQTSPGGLTALGPLPTLPRKDPSGAAGAAATTSPPVTRAFLGPAAHNGTSLSGAPTNLRSPRETAMAGGDPMPRRKASLTDIGIFSGSVNGSFQSNESGYSPESARKPPTRLPPSAVAGVLTPRSVFDEATSPGGILSPQQPGSSRSAFGSPRADTVVASAADVAAAAGDNSEKKTKRRSKSKQPKA